MKDKKREKVNRIAKSLGIDEYNKHHRAAALKTFKLGQHYLNERIQPERISRFTFSLGFMSKEQYFSIFSDTPGDKLVCSSNKKSVWINMKKIKQKTNSHTFSNNDSIQEFGLFKIVYKFLYEINYIDKYSEHVNIKLNKLMTIEKLKFNYNVSNFILNCTVDYKTEILE